MYMTLEFLYKILLLRLFHPVFSCHFPDAQRQVADALMFTCHGVGSCAHLLVPSSQAFFEWLFQLDDEANLGKWLEITLIRGWKKRVPRPAQPSVLLESEGDPGIAPSSSYGAATQVV